MKNSTLLLVKINFNPIFFSSYLKLSVEEESDDRVSSSTDELDDCRRRRWLPSDLSPLESVLNESLELASDAFDPVDNVCFGAFVDGTAGLMPRYSRSGSRACWTSSSEKPPTTTTTWPLFFSSFKQATSNVFFNFFSARSGRSTHISENFSPLIRTARWQQRSARMFVALVTDASSPDTTTYFSSPLWTLLNVTPSSRLAAISAFLAEGRWSAG